MSTSATDPYVGEYLPHLSADATALAMLGRHKRYHSEIVLGRRRRRRPLGRLGRGANRGHLPQL